MRPNHKRLTRSTYTDREAERKDLIDRTKTLCRYCNAVVGTLEDFCGACGACLRSAYTMHVKDCVQGLSAPMSQRLGRLKEMCHESDETEGVFDEERLT